MTVPALRLSTIAAVDCQVDVLVIGVASGPDGPTLLSADPGFADIASSLTSIGATGGVNELVRIPASHSAASSIALVGLGSGPLTPARLRYAAGTASRRLAGVASIALALPVTTDADVLAVLEGAAIGAYAYSEHRSGEIKQSTIPVREIVVLTANESPELLLTRATVVARAMNTVRDLVNAPPSHLYPESFADAVLEYTAGMSVSVEILAEAELAAGGFGGLLGVGKGSSRAPRLVKLSYSPTAATTHLALVGKGITFDTGGLSLKQPAGMVGMKYDMAGAATVMAVLLAAAELELPIRLTAWLCMAENMPSSTAIRPNDVLTLKGGTTVEVLNTDAEGRIVLADGLVAASQEFPDAIIDVATLTGAQKVALGDRYSAVMGDRKLVAAVVAAAEASDELFWPMPLPDELRAALDSDVADIANARIGNAAGGMLLAGVFLREFIGKQRDPALGAIPWAHLDIASPAHHKGSGYGFTSRGPTAVAVRMLLTLAEDFSRA